MRPGDKRAPGPEGQGGIPDGLLVGILAFLLGMTLLVWTSTGLAALFSHGAWPTGVTFTRTPLAMRHLAAQPHDIPGAWPEARETALSGYGLFWGLLIGELMILFVLTVFVMGTLARWRAVRARRRTGAQTGTQTRAGTAGTAESPEAREAQQTPAHHEVPTPRAEAKPSPDLEPGTEATAATPTPAPVSLPVPATVIPTTPSLLYGPAEIRHITAAEAVRDAEGPILVVTSSPALWQDTKDARAKLGPVHLYDPTHRCDTPARLHWSPTTGCEDRETAKARATALLAPVRPSARLDQAVNDTAETLLRSCLHAAAIDGRTIRHVHRWSQGTGIQEAVRTLRTSPKAAPGAAGELEAALTAHPERRDIAQELTSRALSALSTINIREACTPNRTDALALDSFVAEGGTVYVVGESIEDPRTSPGAMPLLTALVSSVVERGRRMAERSSSGRLDPPLTLVLDDIAAVAPLPQLPELLSTGAGRGLPTLALLRSREQARARWPHHELPV
ncbi:type IV secretory system conjugative DNA transfer family protein [Streptomyces sp. NBC_01275]|uniref:type IV secretory system conjugative DNA transfer family protein n=1 Tax=Streptomyces sp. NBC_01275 TaxID=2903807 RepID=UPI00224E3E77|nr:type IV secretory system conjugative DNA transfer family protein [Streptomyces sp. NBC_01275]MCX4763192.1 type IV secretory system conjugative DNA transfer family protein [Streptomyces sp. NBC_01275]